MTTYNKEKKKTEKRKLILLFNRRKLPMQRSTLKERKN